MSGRNIFGTYGSGPDEIYGQVIPLKPIKQIRALLEQASRAISANREIPSRRNLFGLRQSPKPYISVEIDEDGQFRFKMDETVKLKDAHDIWLKFVDELKRIVDSQENLSRRSEARIENQGLGVRGRG